MTIASYYAFVEVFEALEAESAPLTDHSTRDRFKDARPKYMQDLLHGKIDDKGNIVGDRETSETTRPFLRGPSQANSSTGPLGG